MKLFLGGDVMTGRGIDQILRHPGNPALHESWMHSALDYVTLAERVSGAIPRSVDDHYIWGDLLPDLVRCAPDLRIINLETAITARGVAQAKMVHYRMHPANIGCLRAAAVDCCVLANNHAGDWGSDGLLDTLATLHRAGIATSGAGHDAAEAAHPARLATATGRRVRVLAVGSPSSGVPSSWMATADRPGIRVIERLERSAVDALAGVIAHDALPGDTVVLSIHWGPNWSEGVPRSYRRFARDLIERAGVHVVFGHSSHHPLGIEVHAGHPILYGCGDLINDYEGIPNHAAFRPELGLGYVVELDDTDHTLRRLDMLPYRRVRFRLQRADADDREWLRGTMARRCRPLGGGVAIRGGTLELTDAF